MNNRGDNKKEMTSLLSNRQSDDASTCDEASTATTTTAATAITPTITASFNDLPCELVEMVISMTNPELSDFTHYSRVCKKWSAIVHNHIRRKYLAPALPSTSYLEEVEFNHESEQGIKPEMTQEFKQEFRRKLKQELKHELRQELKQELRQELKQELQQEFQQLQQAQGSSLQLKYEHEEEYVDREDVENNSEEEKDNEMEDSDDSNLFFIDEFSKPQTWRQNFLPRFVDTTLLTVSTQPKLKEIALVPSTASTASTAVASESFNLMKQSMASVGRRFHTNPTLRGDTDNGEMKNFSLDWVIVPCNVGDNYVETNCGKNNDGNSDINFNAVSNQQTKRKQNYDYYNENPGVKNDERVNELVKHFYDDLTVPPNRRPSSKYPENWYLLYKKNLSQLQSIVLIELDDQAGNIVDHYHSSVRGLSKNFEPLSLRFYKRNNSYSCKSDNKKQKLSTSLLPLGTLKSKFYDYTYRYIDTFSIRGFVRDQLMKELFPDVVLTVKFRSINSLLRNAKWYTARTKNPNVANIVADYHEWFAFLPSSPEEKSYIENNNNYQNQKRPRFCQNCRVPSKQPPVQLSPQPTTSAEAAATSAPFYEEIDVSAYRFNEGDANEDAETDYGGDDDDDDNDEYGDDDVYGGDVDEYDGNIYNDKNASALNFTSPENFRKFVEVMDPWTLETTISVEFISPISSPRPTGSPRTLEEPSCKIKRNVNHSRDNDIDIVFRLRNYPRPIDRIILQRVTRFTSLCINGNVGDIGFAGVGDGGDGGATKKTKKTFPSRLVHGKPFDSSNFCHAEMFFDVKP